MKRCQKAKILWITILLIFAVALSSCFGMPLQNQQAVAVETAGSANSELQMYTVTFDLNGGTLIDGDVEQQIEQGNAAIAPQVENGNAELSWDRDFTNISSDIIVTAQWEKKELSPTEVADIVQKSTVTIDCEYYNGSGGSGSGFFIDDLGTLVTCYHVIEYATDIEVEVPGAGKFSVQEIVAFNELNDLAILKIDMPNSPGLAVSKEDAKVGEVVYSNGSALGELKGTFTSGTVSSMSRTVNGISCIQMDAAISSGNSGGPLVNASAEVIGVTAMSYTAGESLNLAVNIENLKDLSGNEVHYSIKDYEEWIMKEADRSYSPYTNYLEFFYSTVNTYTHVTEQSCISSVDFDGTEYDGYVDECEYYIYEYVTSAVDEYVAYLNTKGFKFTEREEFDEGVSYYYYNEWSEMTVDMFQTVDGYLGIWVYYNY